MNLSEVNTIISKFIDNEATRSEKAFLMEWIKEGDNKAHFKDFVNTDIWIKYNFDTGLLEEQLASLSISASPKTKKTRNNIFAYASCSALLLAMVLFFYLRGKPSYIPVLDVNTISLEVNEGEGETRYYSLEDLTNFAIDDTSIQLQENGLLKYSASKGTNQESASETQHILHVPYGKTFEVHFTDGSSVHLNAGSRLSYPKNFDAHDARQVSLVGEAYFKIAKSTKPFLVHTEDLSTKVLGTEFNVSAYADDATKEIVLVEGSVELLQDTPEHTPANILIPNQRATKTNTENTLFIENVDVKNHIAWMDGVLIFNSDTIAGIIKKLERRFNIRIDNTYEKLQELRFNGRFQDENLDEILKTMKAHTDFSYALIGNVLIIDKPK